MHDWTEVLQDALQAYGYRCTAQTPLEGQTGTVYTIPLLAEGTSAFIVDAQLEGDVLPETLDDLQAVATDVGADAAVLLHTGAAPETSDVFLWGPEFMVKLLGEAAVARLLGSDPPELSWQAAEPIAASLEELLPSSFQDDFDDTEIPTHEDPEYEVFGGEEPDPAEPAFAGENDEWLAFNEVVGDVEDGTAASNDADIVFEDEGVFPSLEALASSPAAEPDEPPAMEDLLASVDQLGNDPAPHPHKYALLPVLVTPEEARNKVQERLFAVRQVSRVLQPVHLFDYECDLLSEGSLRYETVQGRLQVHGMTKGVSEVDPDGVAPDGFTRWTHDVEMPTEEKTLRCSDERAHEESVGFLMENHTRMVDVVVQDEGGSFSYTERKKVTPRPDHVRLARLGVFYRVIWRLHGPNGHIDVDALTGEEVEQALQSPNPDAMLIE